MNEKLNIEKDYDEEKIEIQKKNELMQSELKQKMLEMLNSERKKSTREIESLNLLIQSLNEKHETEIKEAIDNEKRKSNIEIDHFK